MSKKLSDSDKTLFRETVKGVKPLKIDTIQPQTHQPKIRIRRETEKQIDYRPLSDHYPEEVGREEKIEFMQPSIQPKYFRELKLEKFPIEARLDLHGLNSDSAREQL
ncbi:MAG: DNA mismatch repair protein MutS, partial [Proteobacteria bacterium]|nr:DNA mismatch repair protein MutS [Pseudomonadota bacterium]